MIDNFELIAPLLKFPNDDIYYHLQMFSFRNFPISLIEENKGF